MSNCDYGSSGSELFKRLLNLLFRFGVERRRRLIEKKDRRAFPRAACADERVSLAWFDLQIQIFDRVGDGVCVAKDDIFKIEPTFRERQFNRVWGVLHSRLQIQNSKNLSGGLE